MNAMRAVVLVIRFRTLYVEVYLNATVANVSTNIRFRTLYVEVYHFGTRNLGE